MVGSVAEGTRVGLGNELDLMVDFQGWNEEVPFKIRKDDAFHLYATPNSPSWMARFITDRGELMLDAFSLELLRGVDLAVQSIFR